MDPFRNDCPERDENMPNAFAIASMDQICVFNRQSNMVLNWSRETNTETGGMEGKFNLQLNNFLTTEW